MKYEKEIRALLNKVLKIKSTNIAITQDLRRYGLDSMNYIELILEIENCFGILIPEEKLSLSSTRNIKDINNLIIKIKEDNDEQQL